MRARGLCIALVCAALAIGCRKRVVPSVDPPPPAKSVVASSTPSTTASVIAVASVDPPTFATPPSLACTTDARLRWAHHETDVGSLAPPSPGTAGFDCSPLKGKSTGSSLTLDVAPGTILTFPVAIQLQNGSEWSDVDDPKYVTAGLPKGAWVDPDAREFKWHVAGTEGQTFGFAVGVTAKLPEGARCIVASMIVRVTDTDATRAAQAQRLDRETSATTVLGSLGPPTTATAEWLDFDRRAKCGDGFIEPLMTDVDADGKKDALFSYPSRGGGFPPGVGVWVRKGETFASLGTASGQPEIAPDGTAFIVDPIDGATGISCTPTIAISRIFGNRIQELPRPRADVVITENACDAKGIVVDHDKSGRFIGYTAHNSPKSPPVERVYRWNGKTFAEAKSPPP